MASSSPFVGYPGLIFGVCWQSLNWLNGILTSTSAPTAYETPIQTVFNTLFNGLSALSAWQVSSVLGIETQNMSVVELLPLGLDDITEEFLTSRAAAISNAANGIAALVPNVSLANTIGTLNTGSPAIPDPMFLEWCMTFAGETPPVGSILPYTAATCAQAWLAITNAIYALEGNAITAAYDTAARQYRCASIISYILSSCQSGAFNINSVDSQFVQLTDSDGNPLFDSDGNPIYSSVEGISAYAWTQAVALPTILLDAATLGSNPASSYNQQVGVIRYILGQQLLQLATTLVSIRNQLITFPQTAILRNTESLMDMANRVTGDFENWANIVQLNGLAPPFPGASNPSLSLAGAPLFTSGRNATTNQSTRKQTYFNNVLGTDYDFGPINGIQPTWLGDITLITGYLNFARSIGRRLQTPLGSLIYHPDYGSSIPAEVGAVQTQDEATRITAYGKSAIAGDPRTGSIISAVTTILPGFFANFSAVVAPIGPEGQPTTINEVIGSS